MTDYWLEIKHLIDDQYVITINYYDKPGIVGDLDSDEIEEYILLLDKHQAEKEALMSKIAKSLIKQNDDLTL